jgi:hypothetical protein
MHRPLDESTAAGEFELAARSISPASQTWSGRGIVIPAGGPKYFPCAYVNVRMLRHVGCSLPIELWHLGEAELDDEMRGIVSEYGVTCIDATEVRKVYPARTLAGWELKPYALLHSAFAEAILLDADNVALVDPSFLFEAQADKDFGAIFWPDYGCLAPDRTIWALTGVPYGDEPEFESGQMIVDKRRCRRELSLAMWMNEHSDFWYQHIHGDKETFHLAWRKLGTRYGMPSHRIESLHGVMCQHDFEGHRIFQHRNSHKFSLEGPNKRIAGFRHEQQCFDWLAELRTLWRGRPNRPYNAQAENEETREIATRLCASRWLYRRVGYDERPMTFVLDGTVAEGAAECEVAWNLTGTNGELYLILYGRDGLTCRLRRDRLGRWVGRWAHHERMPIELTEIAFDRTSS